MRTRRDLNGKGPLLRTLTSRTSSVNASSSSRSLAYSLPDLRPSYTSSPPSNRPYLLAGTSLEKIRNSPSSSSSRSLFAPTRSYSSRPTNSEAPTESSPADTSAENAPTCKIVYDGSCPVCTLAVKKLGRSDVELVNARENVELTKKLNEQGFDLDKGMVVFGPEGKIHFGADAVKEIGKQKGGMYSFFLNSSLMEKVYPLLRAIRNSLIPETIAEQQAREKLKQQASNGESAKGEKEEELDSISRSNKI
ncbi:MULTISPECIES: DCC1-like thiol-disulfide oxidoreductase family protein [Legionella]|uniref:DUF393 domain-containing protein n=1 Tax=Legionella drozanskii LLAP-1 TaxID=1212489 RepID=A0A0W0SQV0_9GAMM|nr:MULTISPECIES: DCC1-like thiol-disulfide oxidoreductase family protein [Legionella]KTC85577.1 hypothetical protein Ldro_1902 [Legionella drozanskii LLAP-1]PJE15824.1 MAG: DUF393 domain-containing protein [Legionella sp.]